MKVYNLYIIALTVLLLSGCKQENRNHKNEDAAVAYTDAAILENSDQDTAAYNPYPEYNFEGEGYTETIENPFENPATKPLSTFSIDVDNASYTNIRRMINNGEKIPIGAVRVEEMINFFKYKYPQPTGNQPFSINTELNDCPWNNQHKLLKIRLQGKIIQNNNLPPSNLVFLIDVSGSMEDDNKLPLLKESMNVLVEELRPEDKVSIVVYAGAAGVVLESVSGQ
jgi:Ca-activated chloride channel family protein